jgi:hypothetical protein
VAAVWLLCGCCVAAAWLLRGGVVCQDGSDALAIAKARGFSTVVAAIVNGTDGSTAAVTAEDDDDAVNPSHDEL